MGLIDYFDTSTLLVLVGSFLYLKWLLNEPGNLPPGPRRWPVIGSLLALTKYPQTKGYKAFQELAKQYGDIYTLKLGSGWMIVLADPTLTKEAYIQNADKLSDRPIYSKAMRKMEQNFGSFGVVWASEDLKKPVRRFTLSALRDFGFGKRTLVDRIVQEIEYFRAEIRKTDGKPFNPEHLTMMTTSNVMCSICFGDRFSYDEAEFVDMVNIVEEISRSASFAEVGMIFDWLAWLPPSQKAKDAIKRQRTFVQSIDKQIEQHKATFDPNNPRDFIDLYLAMEQNEKETRVISASRMRAIILDMFFVGTDTTSTALTWLLKFMIGYPEVQKKCRQEIDKVIGQDRLPNLADKADMPFVEATIHEMLRKASIAAMGVPHYAMESCCIGGFTIPQGASVVSSIYTVFHNPELWENPDEFCPERWLDKDGNFQKNDNDLGFGLGPRSCIGESLAKQELFLFFTGILQEFDLSKENDDVKLEWEAEMGLSNRSPSYKLIATQRTD